MTVTIGKPAEWADFEIRHSRFLERYSTLAETQTAAFIRSQAFGSRRDMLVFYTGRLAVDDFQQILLLAGNGEGIGALKILRGLYERVVHGRYLSQASDEEVDNFIFWHPVQKRKILAEMRRVFGPAFFSDLGLEEQLAEAEAAYDAARAKYLVRHCDHCEKTRVGHSWSKKSLLQMADVAGATLRDLTHSAYYIPMEHVHSSISGLLHHLVSDDDGTFTFKDGPHRQDADLALEQGHLLLLNALSLQHDYFGLGELKPQIDACFEAFRFAWHPTPGRS